MSRACLPGNTAARCPLSENATLTPVFFIKARDHAQVAKIMLGTQSAEFLEASRALWQAKRSVRPQTKERDHQRTVAAFRALVEAHTEFERSYRMSFAEPADKGVDPMLEVGDPTAVSDAELSLRPPMSPSGPYRFRLH